MLQVHKHWQKQVPVRLCYQNTYVFTEPVIVCKHFILITPSQISQEFLLLASGGPGDSSHVRLSWSVSGCANGKCLVPEVIPILYLDTNRSGPWTLKMAMRHHKNKEMFMMPIRGGGGFVTGVLQKKKKHAIRVLKIWTHSVCLASEGRNQPLFQDREVC